MKQRFGELVDVRFDGNTGRSVGNRSGDASPHYGDAAVVHSGQCSSNFAFTNIFGVRMTATAGHCGPNGWLWYSGPNLVGAASYRSLPNPDMEILWSSGQAYTNVIYTDPCCPSQRTVIAKVDAGQNSYVCVGGSVSLAQCGAQVIGVNEQFCDELGCTYALSQAFRLGSEAISLPGDSGGVVYQRSGSTGALGAGLIVAGGGPGFGGYTTWYHTVSQVEAQFGFRLATTP